MVRCSQASTVRYVYRAEIRLVLHICYDDFLKEIESSELRDGDSSWKVRRQQILRSVENLVYAIQTGGKSLEKEEDNEFFAKFVAMVISKSPASDRLLFRNDDSNELRTFILLLDDNFYYRSMRNECVRLAERLRCGYVQIAIACPVDECLKRNRVRSREARVPDDVVQRMNETFEPPSEEETSTLVVSSNLDEETLDSLETILAKELDNPRSLRRDSDEVKDMEKAASRASNSASTIHAVDCYLRKCVSNEIRLSKPSALKANSARRAILKAVRSGELLFDGRLSGGDFYGAVSEMFRSYMS